MKVYVRTDIGNSRELNEDSYYTPQEGECFCAVADGMGGHNAGEVASAMAVEAFAREMRACPRTGSAMCQAVERANEAVYGESQRNVLCSGMGTTFTALMMSGGRASIAHVGDSRVYLLRKGTVMRLTIDHTVVEEMVLKGIITQREAKYHPRRNLITRALGTDESVEVDLIEIELMRNDVFLLCTDGFSNSVDEKEILEYSEGRGAWQDKLDALMRLALKNGGSDNITAMYAICEEDDL